MPGWDTHEASLIVETVRNAANNLVFLQLYGDSLVKVGLCRLWVTELWLFPVTNV